MDKEKAKFCNFCDFKAIYLCFICKHYYCENCFKIIHDLRKNRQHQKEKINPFISIDIKCPKHPEYPMELFCVEEKGKNIHFIYNFLFLFLLELCCAYCYYENLHYNHKLINISDIETMKKENITIESAMNNFNEISQKIINLKKKIEDEINKINKLYDKTINDLEKIYLKNNEELTKKGNDLKEHLQNEVTKIKEQLEIFISEINDEIRMSDKIKKGIEKFEGEEKNIIKTLTSISKINKTNKNMINLLEQLMKSIKFYFEEDKNNIKYEEYYFNGIYIPNNIEFKDKKLSSIPLSWDIDKINIINIERNKIKYKVEMRKENEKFIKIYEGNNNKFLINNLSLNNNYEVRICALYNDLIGPWSQIKKLNLNELFNIVLKDNLTNKNGLKINMSGRIEDEYIVVGKDGVQYGPYKKYEQGKYLIIYHGEGLLSVRLDVYDHGLNKYFPFQIIDKSQSKVSYEFVLSQNLKKGLEFRAHNQEVSFAIVKNIEVYKYNNI